MANGVVTQEGQLRVAQEFRLIELKSTYGISDLRDATTVTGTGAVTNAVGGGEYRIRVQASGDDALLQSAETGRYIPGYDALIGIGVRIPTAPAGDNWFEWGGGDATNALLFGVDSTGVYINRRKSSTDNKVYQSSWNADKLDGTGDSGLTLDIAKGNIFEIEYTWYGYGVITYKVLVPDGDKQSRVVIVHREKADNEVSIPDPNIPIRAYADAGTTATDISMYVGGRQFSIIGNYNPNFRVTAQEVLQKGSIGTTPLPICTVRRKSAYDSVSVKLDGIDIIADGDVLLEVLYNTTLGGSPSYGAPTNIAATETALEVDTSADGVTGGQSVWKGLVGGSSKAGAVRATLPILDLPNGGTFTVTVRRVTGTNATVDSVISFREEW